MAGQYLTAVFEIRPTKRKAAILERARAQVEALFWKFLEEKNTKGKANAYKLIGTKKLFSPKIGLF